MCPDDKFVTAVEEMNDPTSYATAVDLEIDWDNWKWNLLKMNFC
jgi:hypothetical protein